MAEFDMPVASLPGSSAFVFGNAGGVGYGLVVATFRACLTSHSVTREGSRGAMVSQTRSQTSILMMVFSANRTKLPLTMMGFR